jgi:hypothetical protein
MVEIKDEELDVCTRAIQKFGNEKQLLMAIEELSELTKAIVKYQRHGYNAVWRIKVLEEVADVEMMTLQLRLILEADTGEYDRIKTNKIMNLDAIIKDDDPLRGLNVKKK